MDMIIKKFESEIYKNRVFKIFRLNRFNKVHKYIQEIRNIRKVVLTFDCK